MRRISLVATVTALIGALLFFTAQMALAQTKAPAAAVSPCPSAAQPLCNGWEVGLTVGAAGNGVPNNTVALPSNEGGGVIGGMFGYKYWNPTQNWYLGGAFDALYNGTGGTPAGVLLETVELGGSLQNFFSGPTSPSQGPIKVGPFTAITPFVLSGAAQNFASGRPIVGWASGGGAIFSLGGQWDLKTRYIYTNWGSGTNTQMGLATISYHF